MPLGSSDSKVVLIGGGFYGCCLALWYRRAGYDVTILERGADLITRASYSNQARVHQGYHYPRSVVTGLSCVANFARFAADFPDAVVGSFEKLYGIAKLNSKVTANQFYGFCRRIQAPIQQAPSKIRSLFDRDLVEDIFLVQEFAFDARQLRESMKNWLAKSQVHVRLNVEVRRVSSSMGGRGLLVELTNGTNLETDQAVSCAYSGVNELLHNSGLALLPCKQELAELALVTPPDSLRSYGITIMDGPFFSMMPFPAEKLHSFSHVRYTPHEAWDDRVDYRSPQRYIESAQPQTHFPQMVKDASRYLPTISKTKYERSLFEMKTILTATEHNDGRPILFRQDYGFPGFHVVLGGKIDNIYDIGESMGLSTQFESNSHASQNTSTNSHGL